MNNSLWSSQRPNASVGINKNLFKILTRACFEFGATFTFLTFRQIYIKKRHFCNFDQNWSIQLSRWWFRIPKFSKYLLQNYTEIIWCRKNWTSIRERLEKFPLIIMGKSEMAQFIFDFEEEFRKSAVLVVAFFWEL